MTVKDDLIAELLDGAVDGRAFAKRCNALARAYVDSVQRILSAKAFAAVFGQPSDDEPLLVNPELAERVYARGVPESYRRAD